MRVLFTTLAASGHFHPLVPIARAVEAAGHTVAFACAASFIPTVAQAGFDAFPAGLDTPGRSLGELFPGWLAVPEYHAAEWVAPRVFIEVNAAAITPDLLALGHSWSPDLIVREAAEYGGCVAAEVLGIPHASVRTTAHCYRHSLQHLIAAPLTRLRERNGLPPDPEMVMPFRYLHLAAEPPGFVPAGDEPASTAHLLRPINYDAGGGDLPQWVAALPDQPTVYATLGTVVSRRPSGQATFRAMLDALRDEPINLILTVGRGTDPAQFGPQPENVHIERYIPQGLLLPHCDVAVNQGGFSTITGILNAGLPMVVIPISADQPINAACCAARDVGVMFGPEERTPEMIRSAVRAVLAEPTYRRNAERVRDEMAALPGTDYAVELLEQLAAEKRPLLTA